MCLASTTRQPCSVGSCIAVTRNWPFGLKVDVEVRALPFEHFGRGLRVRKPQRHAVVVRDREPEALRREGQPADRRRHLDRARLALARLARRPACRPTRRPRRRARPRRDRSSAAWRRSRPAGCRPCASVANTLPSSPPVTMRDAVARGRRECRRHGRRRRRSSPLSGTSSNASSPSTKTAVRPRKCTADDRRARGDGARAFDDRRRCAGVRRQPCAPVLTPRSSRSPCGSSLPAVCGR